MLYPNYSTKTAAKHAAEDASDETWMPQTVFHHPVWGWSHTHAFATIMQDKKTKMAVTFLPTRYFVS